MSIKICQQIIQPTEITHKKIKTEETHELKIGVELIFKLVGGKERQRHPKTMMGAIRTERRKGWRTADKIEEETTRRICYTGRGHDLCSKSEGA